jgi:hypothetical protein
MGERKSEDCSNLLSENKEDSESDSNEMDEKYSYGLEIGVRGR